MLPSNILMSLAISGMLTSQLLKLCSERNAKQNLRLLLALTSSGLCSADCKVMFLKHIFMSWWAVELTMRSGWQQKISAYVSVYSLLLFLRLRILGREPFIVFALIFDWNLILPVEAAWTHCFTAAVMPESTVLQCWVLLGGWQLLHSAAPVLSTGATSTTSVGVHLYFLYCCPFNTSKVSWTRKIFMPWDMWGIKIVLRAGNDSPQALRSVKVPILLFCQQVHIKVLLSGGDEHCSSANLNIVILTAAVSEVWLLRACYHMS